MIGMVVTPSFPQQLTACKNMCSKRMTLYYLGPGAPQNLVLHSQILYLIAAQKKGLVHNLFVLHNYAL